MAERQSTRRAHNFQDLTGRTFGRLTVISYVGRSPARNARWLCRCLCGAETVAFGGNLQKGRTKSCGCGAKSHEMTDTPEYFAYHSMKQRCTNPGNASARNYSGRGITVCPEWMESFEAFLAHVGPKPSPQHSLDRIDNDRGYEPDNVRWATGRQQSNNRSNNVRLTHGGLTLTMTEWARRKGLGPRTLWMRLRAYGWTVAQALERPVRPQKSRKE